MGNEKDEAKKCMVPLEVQTPYTIESFTRPYEVGLFYKRIQSLNKFLMRTCKCL